MSPRRLFQIANGLLVAIILIVLLAQEDDGYHWLPVLISLGLFLHFSIDSLIALKRMWRRQRIRDLGEFAAHKPWQLEALRSALMDDPLMKGMVLPVVLEGQVEGAKTREAPLSGQAALAWQIEAELLDGAAPRPEDAYPAPVDSWWGQINLTDLSGTIPLTGPGLLDCANMKEQIYSGTSLSQKFPAFATIVSDHFGLDPAKAAKARFLLREIRLAPQEPVQVYGLASRSAPSIMVTGTDELDDAGSLFIRSSQTPASRRRSSLGRRGVYILAAGIFSLIAVVIFALTMSPGGSRAGRMLVNEDGRAIRVTVDGHVWSFATGERGSAVELQIDQLAVLATAASALKIERVIETTQLVVPGETLYPRWDGASWTLSLDPEASRKAATADAHQGKLLVRNLSDEKVVIRIRQGNGELKDSWDWTFGPKAHADQATGNWISTGASIPYLVRGDERLELTTGKGYRRILGVNQSAQWQDGQWHIDLVNEFLAGPGTLRVRNLANQDLRVWLMGADGSYLYGQNPWEFEARDGAGANRGSALQVDGADVVFSGRETIRYALVNYRTVFQGPLEKIARWRDEHWELDFKSAGE